MGKNFIIFEAGMSSSLHIDNSGKNISIFIEEQAQGLDDITLTTEAICPIILYNQIKYLYSVYFILVAVISYLLML